jgi:cytochrome oxidase Cu insertion factor (SCO1/SenC/PrrC family)
MKYKKKQKKQGKGWILWLSGIVALALIFTILAVIQNKQTTDNEEAGLPAGTEAPDFTLQSTQGNISLADYKGKNVVIYFYEGNG